MPDPPRFKPPVISEEERAKMWAQALQDAARTQSPVDLPHDPYSFFFGPRDPDEKEPEETYKGTPAQELAWAKERNVQAALRAINPQADDAEAQRRAEMVSRLELLRRQRYLQAEQNRIDRDFGPVPESYGEAELGQTPHHIRLNNLRLTEPVPNQKTETSGLPPVAPPHDPTTLQADQYAADHSITPEETEAATRRAEVEKGAEALHAEHPVVRLWKSIQSFRDGGK